METPRYVGAAEQETVTNQGFAILCEGLESFGVVSEEMEGELICLEGKWARILSALCLVFFFYCKPN